jgi:hypothetical protein
MQDFTLFTDFTAIYRYASLEKNTAVLPCLETYEKYMLHAESYIKVTLDR